MALCRGKHSDFSSSISTCGQSSYKCPDCGVIGCAQPKCDRRQFDIDDTGKCFNCGKYHGDLYNYHYND